MGTRPASSPFELPLNAEIVAKVQQAVDLAQASSGEVMLFTNGIPPDSGRARFADSARKRKRG